MQTLVLIVERSQGELWGRVHYGDDLLIGSAKSIAALERKMKKLLKDFHHAEPAEITFEHQFDLAALFEKFNYLKITAIAERSKLNPALLRQYVTGIKHPSARQAMKVEKAIHSIGRELTKVAVYAE